LRFAIIDLCVSIPARNKKKIVLGSFYVTLRLAVIDLSASILARKKKKKGEKKSLL
jgi:hypothetical protein